MEDTNDTPMAPPRRGIIAKFGVFLQWIVFALIALLAAGMLIPNDKLAIPDAPIRLYWATGISVALIALAMFPPVFLRLPGGLRKWPYIAILPALVLLGVYGSRQRVAWEATPKGKIEAEQMAQAEAATATAAARQRSAEMRREQLAASAANAAAQAEALESCFSTFGQKVPALADAVRNAAHNPDAFEHVETITVGPFPNGYNVRMQFRAENAFGALRAFTIDAEIDPESCAVEDIGDAIAL